MHLLRILDWNAPKNVQHRIKLELLYELTRLQTCAVSCLRKDNVSRLRLNLLFENDSAGASRARMHCVVQNSEASTHGRWQSLLTDLQIVVGSITINGIRLDSTL